MGRVSKHNLPNHVLEEIQLHFSSLLSFITNATEIEKFLEDFLTKEEKIMLSKRLLLYMMLKKHYTPSQIQSTLHISYETIRTYQNQFASKNQTFLKLLDGLITSERVKGFLKKIEAFFKPFDLAMRAKSDMKARAKFLSGDWT